MDTPTKYISLYSGAGGLDLGFRLANPDSRCVAYVERDAEACALLVDHMQTGQLDDAPLWSDSGTFDGRPWRGKVDFIIGGFPCQPWSVAGKQAGTEDERWLWPHIQRIAGDVEPTGLFLENVPGLVRGGIEHVLGGLADLGFDAEWTSVRASDVGAPHRRERVFILAYRRHEQLDIFRRGVRAESQGSGAELVDSGHDAGSSELRNQHEEPHPRSRQSGEGVADSNKPQREGGEQRNPQPKRPDEDSGTSGAQSPRQRRTQQQFEQGPSETSAQREGSQLAHTVSERGRGGNTEGRYAADAFPPGPGGDWSNIDPRYWPAVKSEVRNLADESTCELARAGQLRLLGNGVVPLQAALAFRILTSRIPASVIP